MSSSVIISLPPPPTVKDSPADKLKQRRCRGSCDRHRRCRHRRRRSCHQCHRCHSNSKKVNGSAIPTMAINKRDVTRSTDKVSSSLMPLAQPPPYQQQRQKHSCFVSPSPHKNETMQRYFQQNKSPTEKKGSAAELNTRRCRCLIVDVRTGTNDCEGLAG